MELVDLTIAGKRERLAGTPRGLVVKDTAVFRAWRGVTVILIAALIGSMVAGWTTVAGGIAVALALLTGVAVWQAHVVRGAWMLRIDESHLFLKLQQNWLGRGEALRLAISDIKSIGGVEIEILWPGGGSQRIQRLIVDVAVSRWAEFDRICCVIAYRLAAANPYYAWLTWFRLPGRFLFTWVPSLAPTLPQFLGAAAATNLETTIEIEKRTINLGGFSKLPQAEADDLIRQMVEVGYYKLCGQLLRTEKKMSSGEAIDYMQRLFPGHEIPQ